MSNLIEKMITNLGSTFPQTGEMPGPTEQKERKTIQEQGELAVVFNLVVMKKVI